MSNWIPTDPHMEYFRQSIPEHRWLAFQNIDNCRPKGKPLSEHRWPVTEVEVEVAVC